MCMRIELRQGWWLSPTSVEQREFARLSWACVADWVIYTARIELWMSAMSSTAMSVIFQDFADWPSRSWQVLGRGGGCSLSLSAAHNSVSIYQLQSTYKIRKLYHDEDFSSWEVRMKMYYILHLPPFAQYLRWTDLVCNVHLSDHNPIHLRGHVITVPRNSTIIFRIIQVSYLKMNYIDWLYRVFTARVWVI